MRFKSPIKVARVKIEKFQKPEINKDSGIGN